jgi:hypothetical protein
VLVSDGLGGMRLPAEFAADSATAKDHAKQLLHFLSHDTPVPVIDVKTQSEGSSVPLSDFVDYYSRTPRAGLLNVVSLSLAGTRLEGVLSAPRLVREADLVANAWPAGAAVRPEVQLYALVSPAESYTDFHLDFGGSSVWYRILAGRKVFLLAPPTPANIKAFVRWASSSRQTREFLGSLLEGVHRYTVSAGELLLIPGGWPHAVYTPEDSFVLGGNFVHASGLALQSLVWRVEDRLSVQTSFRFPYFRALCWHAARWLCGRLPPVEGEEELLAREAAQREARLTHAKLAAGEQEGDDDDLQAEAEAGMRAEAEAAGPPLAIGELGTAETADAPAQEEPPPEAEASGPPLTACELKELAALYSQLRLWMARARSSGHVSGAPPDLPDPRRLLGRLRMRLRAADVAVPTIADDFGSDEQVLPVARVRQRERTAAEAEAPPLLPGLAYGLPMESDEEDDDEEEEDEEGEPKPKKRKLKPKSERKVPEKKRPAPPSVRDRLSKKLGLGRGKSSFRR